MSNEENHENKNGTEPRIDAATCEREPWNPGIAWADPNVRWGNDYEPTDEGANAQGGSK